MNFKYAPMYLETANFVVTFHVAFSMKTIDGKYLMITVDLRNPVELRNYRESYT